MNTEKIKNIDVPLDELILIKSCMDGQTIVINMDKHSYVLSWAIENNLLVKVDADSIFSNPFELGIDGCRDDVAKKYARFFKEKKSLHQKAKELKGKVLGCRCAPLKCHAETLVHAADFNPLKGFSSRPIF